MTLRGISPRKERGIAVITAILIAAMVASLAFALSARERLWLNQMENRKELSAAQAVAFGAIDLARLTLRDDMRNNQQDHLLETWTVPIPPIGVEEGKVSGRLIEMQGRFNLFTLQNRGAVNQAGVGALQRLLATRNLPTEWAGKIAHAMASQAAIGQPEQADAQNQHLRKLLPVANLSELAELTGIEAGKLAALESLVTILPETTAINVNFAPPEILMAITPGLSIGDAELIVNRRASAHFKSSQDYLNALPERLRSISGSSAYGVESQYFLSDVESWFGRAHLRYHALIYRQRNKMPEVLWVKRI
ncbi:type II secretion system minor pseudopilin GspK [Propionivibrio sp.]|uniref:type II secretion system minor pseudopilin GspK n=1 Tax=Propionivibrio sp. TaxID=2212460 RepID=UPI003BF018BA